MGFGGGGGGQLTAHTHDPLIHLDGGSLAANATSFSLANQSLLVSDGVNIQELGIGSEGDNLTSLGGALSWEAHVAGDVLASNLVMSNSTTIGDYTQPTASTCSSSIMTAATYTQLYENSADPNILLTNASGVSPWYFSVDSVVSDALYFDPRRSATIYGQSWDLGSTLSETQWTARIELEITSVDNSGDTCRAFFGMCNNSSATGSTDASNYYIGACCTTNAALSTWYDLSVKGNSMDVGEASTYSLTATTLYIEIIRKSSTKYSVRWTTNSDYSGGTINDDQDVGADGGAGSIANMNLQYFYVSNINVAGNADCHIQGHIRQVEVWDGASSTQPCSNAIDDNVATYWESNSEVNPNIYIDMASATTTSNLALYPNATTTETEIKIQSSTDALAWTDQRTITWSNLSEGAWNYIRFNLVSAQYWRIYGNSGGAGVMAIDEIKVLDAVSDNDVRNLHGHIPISSTDTSLNNAGV